jgi:hypothetical protein
VAVINLDMIGYDGNNDHVYKFGQIKCYSFIKHLCRCGIDLPAILVCNSDWASASATAVQDNG